MQRVQGIKIDDLPALDAAGINCHKLAETDLQIVLTMILEDGFFHADPHPGNFLIEAGGVIGLLDYGMVGQLDEKTRENLLALFLAIVDHDLDRVLDRLEALEIVGATPHLEELKHDLDRLLATYWGRPIAEIDVRQILEEFLNLARRYRLHVPANLSLLSKTLIMHDGLTRELDPTLSMATVLSPYAQELTLRQYEPQRFLKRLLPAFLDLNQLLVTLPRRVDRLLARTERGNLELNVRVEETAEILSALNRMANRLILGILAASFIIGIPLLLQIVHTAGFHYLVSWLLGGGLVVVTALAVWLVVAILRGHYGRPPAYSTTSLPRRIFI